LPAGNATHWLRIRGQRGDFVEHRLTPGLLERFAGDIEPLREVRLHLTVAVVCMWVSFTIGTLR
jgi:hypothetical protein